MLASDLTDSFGLVPHEQLPPYLLFSSLPVVNCISLVCSLGDPPLSDIHGQVGPFHLLVIDLAGSFWVAALSTGLSNPGPKPIARVQILDV